MDRSTMNNTRKSTERGHSPQVFRTIETVVLAALSAAAVFALTACPATSLLTEVQQRVLNAKGGIYSIIYDANGADVGAVPVDNNTYNEGETITLLGNTGGLIRSGFTFAAWNTATDGNGTGYAVGTAFTMPAADVTLYANWSSKTWQAVGSAGFSADGVGYPSLAFDSTDTPYVAFSEGGTTQYASVMRYEGGSWQLVGSGSFSAGQANWESLVIDSSDMPYVAYSDAANSQMATVMQHTGLGTTGWQPVGTGGLTAGTYTSLAISTSDVLYLAYSDGANTNCATVMKYSGGSWQPVGTPGFSAGASTFVSLALDSAGTPFVAYRDGGNGGRSTLMKYTGSGASGWEPVGLPGFSAGQVNDVSLALDSSGIPFVAYQDKGNGNKATLMKYTGAGASGWQPMGPEGFSLGYASYISLAIDTVTDTPYVAYNDYPNNSKATVMKYADGSWQPAGSEGFSAGVANFLDAAFDSTNTLHVAYADYGNLGKATVMAFE